MAFQKLNHIKLNKMMIETGTRPSDLAKSLGLSRQLTRYILHIGGRKYVSQLAKFFNCKEKELLVVDTSNIRVPKKFKIVDGKIKKVNSK